MEIKEFAAWKYDTGSHIKGWFIAALILSAIISVVLGANISPFFFILLLIPVAIAIHLWRAEYEKTLMVTNRYIIIGENIVYFSNVSNARLNRQAETLEIISGKGKSMVVSSAKFPTNARKPDKIKLNRSNKFNKIADRIVARLKDKGVEVMVS